MSADGCGRVRLELDGRALDIDTIERLGQAFDEVDTREVFELVASVDDGPSMSVLRNGPAA